MSEDKDMAESGGKTPLPILAARPVRCGRGSPADRGEAARGATPEITYGVAAMMLGDALKREGLRRILLARIDDSVQISASLGGASETVRLSMFEAISLADWVQIPTRARTIWRLDDHRLREHCQTKAREAKARLLTSGQVVTRGGRAHAHKAAP